MGRYLYTPRLGGDGNHSLQKKAKKDDPTDRSLGGPQGFFNDIRKLHGFQDQYSKERGKIVSGVRIPAAVARFDPSLSGRNLQWLQGDSLSESQQIPLPAHQWCGSRFLY